MSNHKSAYEAMKPRLPKPKRAAVRVKKAPASAYTLTDNCDPWDRKQGNDR